MVLWVAWLIYWVISASTVLQNQREESDRQRFVTALVVGFGGFLIFARTSHLGPLDARFVGENEGVKVVGLAMVVAGLGFSAWARVHIGKFWSSRVSLKQGHQLIQSGPYARVRHPIYSGIFLALIGTTLFAGVWRAVLGTAILFVAHRRKAKREETLNLGRCMRSTGSAPDR